MKKLFCILCAIALLFSFSFSASGQQTWDANKNVTVDSITALYKEKYIAPKSTLTIVDIFPAVGKYESASNPASAEVTIKLDAENKGLIWIEGLPQGKIKAMLRKSPATYKIPVQKTEDGKPVAEGTLLFDIETNTLQISIGKEYNPADPSTAFISDIEETSSTVKKSSTKKKTVTKVWMYTGAKIVKEIVTK